MFAVYAVPVLDSQCVSLCVLDNQSGLSAGPPFLLGYIVYSGLYVDAEAPQERTLDGGAARPLGIKVSWGSSSEEGGAAHGPLHPAVCRSLETLMALLFILLLWSRFCHLLIVSRFFVSGVGLLSGF